VKDYKLELISSNLSPRQPANDVSRQIMVLMSGGVDSSVTAYLLQQQGWDVLGVTMRIPAACQTRKHGNSQTQAAEVCAQLKIPHYLVDVTVPFNELVIEKFRADYRRGLTPNPCADCNTFLKFTLVWELVEKELGINYLATGHYAEVHHGQDGHATLRRGKNLAKDQSYFLYGIPRRRLPYFMLPLAELKKDDVRVLAQEIGLGVANKPESMELCFAGEGDYRAALNDGERCGDLVDMDGNIIGTHKGIAHYTLGQRRGLGYAAGEPVYVARIDAEKNTVALGTKSEVHHAIIHANEVNVLIDEEMQAGVKLFGKLRSYGTPTQPCEIIECGHHTITVKFDEKQFAPSPGQKLVLYNGSDEVVCGGTISGFE
jgi:tRNA-specific 2-thiouridylase